MTLLLILALIVEIFVLLAAIWAVMRLSLVWRVVVGLEQGTAVAAFFRDALLGIRGIRQTASAYEPLALRWLTWQHWQWFTAKWIFTKARLLASRL